MPKVQKRHVCSPTPVSLPESDPNISALDKADTEGYEKDVEAVLEEAAEDSSPLSCHYIVAEASRSIVAIVEKLNTDILKSLCIVHLDSPLPLLGIKRSAKTFKTSKILSCIGWFRLQRDT